MDNCQLHSGRLNNVLGYNLTVTGSDGKHDTVTSQVRIDFRKFSEAAVEQTVILRLETAQSDQVAAVVTGLLAGDDSVQLLSLSLGQNTTDLFLAVQDSDRTYQARPLSVRETNPVRTADSAPARLSSVQDRARTASRAPSVSSSNNDNNKNNDNNNNSSNSSNRQGQWGTGSDHSGSVETAAAADAV